MSMLLSSALNVLTCGLAGGFDLVVVALRRVQKSRQAVSALATGGRFSF
jgi:hypothetical protein